MAVITRSASYERNRLGHCYSWLGEIISPCHFSSSPGNRLTDADHARVRVCLVIQVLRYFGFAQQVGLELGALMPEGLRQTMAFVSILVTMTLDLNKVSQNAAYPILAPIHLPFRILLSM